MYVRYIDVVLVYSHLQKLPIESIEVSSSERGGEKKRLDETVPGYKLAKNYITTIRINMQLQSKISVLMIRSIAHFIPMKI